MQHFVLCKQFDLIVWLLAIYREDLALVCYSLNENKASFLHNLHFLCCAGQIVAPRNIVRTAADEVPSEDYSCVSRDAVPFFFFFCLQI